MPEYSSTTLTPTNETKVPAMQNNSSGNFQLDALKAYILAEKAQANGLASLDATGKLVSSQIPDNLDDVLVYGSYALLPATGVEGKIYITADTNSMYRWDASLETPDYVMLAVDLEEYATKAELQAETNQRKASDSRLEARLENLEQKAGDYTTVQYRGTDAVPTGKAKNGLVKSIVGKSIAWNQLMDKAKIPATQTISDITFTNNGDGSFTLNGTSTGAFLVGVVGSGDMIPIPTGHKILFAGIRGGNSSTYYIQIKNNLDADLVPVLGDDAIFTMTGISLRFNVRINQVGVTVNNIKITPVIYDLTLIFGSGNEPSTVADALAQLPALGQYNAYDAGSLVDTEVSGVESVGVNIWDEEWELGGYSKTDGTKTTASVTIRAKNNIRCLPSTTDFLRSSSVSSVAFCLFFYDANGDFISYLDDKNNTSFTTPNNAVYMTFQGWSVYGTTYNHDIQICLNSYADKATYHPYMTDTLSLSETVTLKSAESVSEVLTLETGKKTRPIGSRDLGTLDWTYNSGTNPFFSTSGITDCADDAQQVNAKGYKTVTSMTLGTTDDKAICMYGAGNVRIRDTAYPDAATFKTAMSGIYINYELATPLPDEQVCDPIIDNFIKVQGGGTIDTIQEQTPVIDNCLDVGYLTV